MNCIIVDDEYPAREELKYFINKYSDDIKIAGEFDNSVDTLKYMEDNNPNIVFLDINMSGMNGIDLAKVINKFNDKPIIIFTTAYGEYAPKAFEVKAFDYIMKPFSDKRIKDVLDRLSNLKLSKESNQNIITDKIPVKKGDVIIMIKIHDISCCKAFEKQTIVYTQDGEYVINFGISKLFDKLPHDLFFKCHRCYILNIENVEEIIPWFNNTFLVKLKGVKEKVPVSRNKVNEFKHLMHL